MKFLTLTSVLLVTAFQAVSSACLPPPPMYSDLRTIQMVVNSSEMSQTLSDVLNKDFANILSVAVSPENENEVTVSFSNKCVAKFQVTWENTDTSIPCGYGYKPTKATRTAFSCE